MRDPDSWGGLWDEDRHQQAHNEVPWTDEEWAAILAANKKATSADEAQAA